MSDHLMDKQAIATITQAAEWLDSCGEYNCSKPMRDTAQALRDLLPKPRFYAEGRSVFDRTTGRSVHYVRPEIIGYHDRAYQAAQDIAASYNTRLGEVE